MMSDGRLTFDSGHHDASTATGTVLCSSMFYGQMEDRGKMTEVSANVNHVLHAGFYRPTGGWSGTAPQAGENVLLRPAHITDPEDLEKGAAGQGDTPPVAAGRRAGGPRWGRPWQLEASNDEKRE